MKRVTLGPETFHFPLYPPKGKCGAELYINKTGKTIECGGKGFVKMPNGQTLCSTHFEEIKKQVS
jgi:hypothetical protein